MRRYVNVQRGEWKGLSARPVKERGDLKSRVAEIVEDVRQRGDRALVELTEKFDGVKLQSLSVSTQQRDAAARGVDDEIVVALEQALANIRRFHSSQCQQEQEVETASGVRCFRRSLPLERVGIYIPGGTAPLVSTLLMLAVPALVAGVTEVALITPPDRSYGLNPVIAQAARLLGIDEIYLCGGAQAIAALAFGTESIRAVDKVCGPGNAYVTEAKLQVSSLGVAIDMPAGPSEALVIADSGADPRWVAADLLAQAEHGQDSQVVLVSPDEGLVDRVLIEIEQQVRKLPRISEARVALEASFALIVATLEEAIEFSNQYAPEHLLLAVREPREFVEKVRNAGSVFLGYMSAEACGDYASGTNHVLPTNGSARAWSGVSVDTFVKKITFQEVTKRGLTALASTVISLARAEGLEAHAQAVVVRQEVGYGE